MSATRPRTGASRPSFRPRALVVGALAVALSAALLPAMAATAEAASVAPTSAVAPATAKPKPKPCVKPSIPRYIKPSPRFYRATTKPGMRDRDVRHVNHVREAQYRLRWLNLYKGPINAFYNGATTTAAKRFQAKYCLKVTGTLDRASWSVLIQKTMKRVSWIPKACRSKGWNACYDRSSHQLFLLQNGQIYNSWLVRGGGRSTQTRTGNFSVFVRYAYTISTIYHVPMAYFQGFSGGQGLHGSYYMIDPWSGHSHGCVNMWLPDGRTLWGLTAKHSLRVHVYGRWS